MSNDRFDEDESGGNFMIGLLAGTALGVGLGMLFAPKPGSELRSRLSEQAGAFANQAQKSYRRATKNASRWAEAGKEAAGGFSESGKDLYDGVRETVTRSAEEAQKYVRDAADAVTGSGGSRRS